MSDDSIDLLYKLLNFELPEDCSHKITLYDKDNKKIKGNGVNLYYVPNYTCHSVDKDEFVEKFCEKYNLNKTSLVALKFTDDKNVLYIKSSDNDIKLPEEVKKLYSFAYYFQSFDNKFNFQIENLGNENGYGLSWKGNKKEELSECKKLIVEKLGKISFFKKKEEPYLSLIHI